MHVLETVEKYKGEELSVAFGFVAGCTPALYALAHDLKFSLESLNPSHAILGVIIAPVAALWMYGWHNGDHHKKAFEYNPEDHKHRHILMQWIKWAWESTGETNITRATRLVSGAAAGLAGSFWAQESKSPGSTYRGINDAIAYLQTHDLLQSAMSMDPHHLAAAALGIAVGVATTALCWMVGHTVGSIVFAPLAHGAHAMWNHAMAYYFHTPNDPKPA